MRNCSTLTTAGTAPSWRPRRCVASVRTAGRRSRRPTVSNRAARLRHGRIPRRLQVGHRDEHGAQQVVVHQRQGDAGERAPLAGAVHGRGLLEFGGDGRRPARKMIIRVPMLRQIVMIISAGRANRVSCSQSEPSMPKTSTKEGRTPGNQRLAAAEGAVAAAPSPTVSAFAHRHLTVPIDSASVCRFFNPSSTDSWPL